jgi:hypothetical protein
MPPDVDAEPTKKVSGYTLSADKFLASDVGVIDDLLSGAYLFLFLFLF